MKTAKLKPNLKPKLKIQNPHFHKEIKFTPAELFFITKSFPNSSITNYDLYLDMILKVIENQFDPTENLVTKQVQDLIEGIQFKIYSYKASNEIDKMLSNPNYGNDPTAQNVTKARSYQMAKKTSSQLHIMILNLLKNGDMSRSEIANATGLKLSSVCARVNELLLNGDIEVTGTKQDSDSERKVEVLGVK